jgi:hypothetical protein
LAARLLAGEQTGANVHLQRRGGAARERGGVRRRGAQLPEARARLVRESSGAAAAGVVSLI